MDIAPELFVGRRDRFAISRRLQSFFACFCVLEMIWSRLDTSRVASRASRGDRHGPRMAIRSRFGRCVERCAVFHRRALARHPDPRRLVRRGRRRRRRRVRGNNDAPAGVRTRPTHISLSSLPPQDGPASQERPALVHAGALRARHRALARLPRRRRRRTTRRSRVLPGVFRPGALVGRGRSPVVERGRRRQIPRRARRSAPRGGFRSGRHARRRAPRPPRARRGGHLGRGRPRTRSRPRLPEPREARQTRRDVPVGRARVRAPRGRGRRHEDRDHVHVPPRVDRGPRGQQRVRVPPRPP